MLNIQCLYIVYICKQINKQLHICIYLYLEQPKVFFFAFFLKAFFLGVTESKKGAGTQKKEQNIHSSQESISSDCSLRCEYICLHEVFGNYYPIPWFQVLSTPCPALGSKWHKVCLFPFWSSRLDVSWILRFDLLAPIQLTDNMKVN